MTAKRFAKGSANYHKNNEKCLVNHVKVQVELKSSDKTMVNFKMFVDNFEEAGVNLFIKTS